MTSTVMLSTAGTSLPLIITARPDARTRMRDFFSSHLRNPNTRRAYLQAVRQFSGSCAEHGIFGSANTVAVRCAIYRM